MNRRIWTSQYMKQQIKSFTSIALVALYSSEMLSSDVGSCNSGFYKLQAVLTHQGRTSSSGHYVAWVRFSRDYWVKCDDDTVTSVTEEEILRLSGGGE